MDVLAADDEAWTVGAYCCRETLATTGACGYSQYVFEVVHHKHIGLSSRREQESIRYIRVLVYDGVDGGGSASLIGR